MKLDVNLEGSIICCQFDYTGKRFAAVTSSDTLIHIYSYAETILSETSVLDGHMNEVLSISWSHPKFHSLLASIGHDRKLIIWREQSLRSWSAIYEYMDSVKFNCIAFAPWELGLKLLGGLDNGSVVMISYKSSWEVDKYQCHSAPITSLTWSNPVSLHHPRQEPLFRFVIGTEDGKLKLFTQVDSALESEVLEKHSGKVRDLCWNPALSAHREFFASASERVVIIWVKALDEPSWKVKEILTFPGPVWKISWNLVGTALAVSAADNYTRIVKENSEETWRVVQQISPKGEVMDLAEG